MVKDVTERWGIVYCPKGDMLVSPAKRWTKIEKCLKEQGVVCRKCGEAG